MKIRLLICVIIGLGGWISYSSAQSVIYVTATGNVQFSSKAPQEFIRAESNELRAALDTASQQFLFKVRLASFAGFNSVLQQNHFNENYVESKIFPESIFKGKIIEPVNWSVPGTYSVRAKGKLILHGVEQERIIQGQLSVRPGNNVQIQSDFEVLLAEHGIPIPRVVINKLSEKIDVKVNMKLALR